jgi:hypothetical protein
VPQAAIGCPAWFRNVHLPRRNLDSGLTARRLGSQARSEYPATFVLFSNRRHVNAAKTIQAFTGRLREELDLDTLTTELLVVVVVNQTIEPTKTSLWLRPSAEGSRRIIG